MLAVQCKRAWNLVSTTELYLLVIIMMTKRCYRFPSYAPSIKKIVPHNVLQCYTPGIYTPDRGKIVPRNINYTPCRGKIVLLNLIN